MQNGSYSVPLKKLVEQLHLENCTPEVSIEDILITQSDVNRPALQLAGYFDYFDSKRIQIIGHVEHTYMQQKGMEHSVAMMERIMAGSDESPKPPCIIYCREIDIRDEIVELANKYKVPLLRTQKSTSSFMAEVIRWLNVELAPRCSVHGVLVDLFGEGVLIMGESGIGKSEVALELVHRGHRLVSDDVVEIKRVSDISLIGSAPNITRHFIELRGVGIIDAKALFGAESVKNEQEIDLVIKLEEYNKEQEYDRLGLEEQYIEFLGNEVVCHSIPIRPGRNSAIICETAAINHRQKKMGYNAALELYNRVTSNLAEKREGE
ncbi:MAG: HPr(Ser) kinase/phosphatase [Lachnospiraceae bacterium]|nr:HPr(Ser) kinase/phosphatase [Lachnospiraceae bacterium]RKI28050.1 HPr(Ser) kinase/phosphatase [bacterium D16-36]RKI69990.1 HPr(Ser) kinase/phosphatase [bacterium 1xD8-6]